MSIREKKKLGDLLVEAGALTESQLQKALKYQQKSGKKLGRSIVDQKIISEEDLINSLAKQLNIDVINLDETEPEPELLKKLPEGIARKHILIPLKKNGQAVTVVMADPLNIFAIDEIALKLSCDITVAISGERQVQSAINRFYGERDSIDDAIRSLRVAEAAPTRYQALAEDIASMPYEEAPIARLVDVMVTQAVDDRASDIHIEPDEDDVKIRTRIDGLLFAGASVPKELQSAVISRVKVISHMDIAETRTPQDGRFKKEVNGAAVEFRVSTFPTIYGENVVIRILNRGTMIPDIEGTGLGGGALEKARSLFETAFGIVVVTGPTGSGKTSTLYAALNMINVVEKNIITIEDPVEYRLAGIRQTQVNLKAGLDFASSMRSILRQDPDVIMVGEIRDRQTAELAVQAAMTGHLVLTTLHTNDAPSAVIRLADLGIEPYMIASGLTGVIAQRLVRRICHKCKRALAETALPPDFTKEVTLYEGAGCVECKNSGYAGRIGIFELLTFDEQIRELVMERAPAPQIRECAVSNQGMKSMRQDGYDKAVEGITTVNEVTRVTADF